MTVSLLKCEILGFDVTQIVVGRTGTEMLTNEAGEVTRLFIITFSFSLSTFVAFWILRSDVLLFNVKSLFFVHVAICKGCLIEPFVFLKLELSLCNVLLPHSFFFCLSILYGKNRLVCLLLLLLLN